VVVVLVAVNPPFTLDGSGVSRSRSFCGDCALELVDLRLVAFVVLRGCCGIRFLPIVQMQGMRVFVMRMPLRLMLLLLVVVVVLVAVSPPFTFDGSGMSRSRSFRGDFAPKLVDLWLVAFVVLRGCCGIRIPPR